MTAPNLARSPYSNWSVALSRRFNSCHAGFWSTGVGGTYTGNVLKVETVLPRPGGSLVQVLEGLVGKYVKPSSYRGPVLGRSGFGPAVTGMYVGKMPALLAAWVAAVVAVLVPVTGVGRLVETLVGRTAASVAVGAGAFVVGAGGLAGVGGVLHASNKSPTPGSARLATVPVA